MERETGVMSFMSLFLGIIALQSLFTPATTGAGIITRIGGLLAFRSTPFMSALVILLLILLIITITYYSVVVDLVRFDAEFGREEAAAMSYLAGLFVIFLLLAHYAPREGAAILVRILVKFAPRLPLPRFLSWTQAQVDGQRHALLYLFH